MKGFLSSVTYILNKTEKRSLFVFAAGDMLTGVLDVLLLAVLLFIIRIYTGAGTILGMAAPYAKYVNVNPILITGLVLLLFCLKNIAAVFISQRQHHFVYAVASRLSNENILRYLKGSYADFVEIDSSVRIRQISQLPIEFSHYVLTNLQQIIAQGLLILFTVAAIMLYHPILFILLLILLLPPVAILGWLARHQINKVRTQIKQNAAKAIQYLNEALAGYVESNIYNRHQFFAERYHCHQDQLNHNLASQQTLQGASSRFIEVFAVLGFFVLVAVNKLTGSSAGIDVLTIGVFMAAAYKIIPGMVKILNSMAQIKTYSFTLGELAAGLPKVLAETFTEDKIECISFSNVAFSFNDTLVTNNLSFEINRGDFIGMSAQSGKGKTTVINLLLGFLHQHAGVIAINGREADPARRRTFWNRISYVKQQPFFINDTILKNITLSDGVYDDNQLQTALHISGLDIFLKDCAEGINKMILENGKNISGGQRQRLALARALYRSHDLLILDEPFSELDEQAEKELWNRLQTDHVNGRAVVVVTHNPAALAFCNKIVSP